MDALTVLQIKERKQRIKCPLCDVELDGLYIDRYMQHLWDIKQNKPGLNYFKGDNYL